MILAWADDAWDDYLYWQAQDKKTLKRINLLIKDVMRHPFEGLGEPEPLKHNWQGFWSRRIDLEHRLVYQVRDDTLFVAQCRYHYGYGRRKEARRHTPFDRVWRRASLCCFV